MIIINYLAAVAVQMFLNSAPEGVVTTQVHEHVEITVEGNTTVYDYEYTK